MPTPSVPEGIGRASMTFTCDASSHISVCTFHFNDQPGNDVDDVATDIRANWLAGFPLSGLDTSWAMGPNSVLVNRGGSEFVGIHSSTDAGTTAFASMAIGACASMRKRTGFVGRRFRGRCFLPAGYIPEADVDEGGVIAATPLGALTTNWQTLIADLNTNAYGMVLVSADLTRVTAVASGDIDPKIHWLRRRMR